MESRRFIRGVTASFGVNLLCCGLHYFNADATRPGGMGDNFSGRNSFVPRGTAGDAWSPGAWNNMAETRPPPHGGRTRAAVLVPIRHEENLLAQSGTSPRVWVRCGGPPGAASHLSGVRDRVLERSARWVPTRRSVGLAERHAGEASGGAPLDTIQVGMRGNAPGPV